MISTNKIHGNTIHGKTKSTEYKSWAGMKERCANPNHPKYKYYGGRGIKVCERWLDFSDFYIDMGDKPSKTHSIDRNNVNGDYEPSNCRWATSIEQNRNRSVQKSNKTGYSGVHWDKNSSKWRSAIYVNNKRIHLGFFVNINDAIEIRKKAEMKYWNKTCQTEPI